MMSIRRSSQIWLVCLVLLSVCACVAVAGRRRLDLRGGHTEALHVLKRLLQNHFPDDRYETVRLPKAKRDLPSNFTALVDSYAQGLLQCYGMPGITLSAVALDEVVYMNAFGYRDTVNRLNVTTKTLFGIGSTTKAFTSTGLAMAQDQGLFNFDTLYSTYNPGFTMNNSFASSDLRPRDMLSHRTGVSRNDLIWTSGINKTRNQVITDIRYLTPNLPFRYQFEYNNFLVAAAGIALEHLYSTSWENFVTSKLLRPLGMNTTTTDYASAIATGDYAVPHAYYDGQPMPLPTTINERISLLAPAGVISSNAQDMTQWMRFHLNKGMVNGVPVVSAASLQETHEPTTATGWANDILLPQVQVPYTADQYGFGWVSGTYRGYRQVWHDGGTLGHTTLLILMPDVDVGVFMSVNSIDGNEESAELFLSWYILDLLLGEEPWVSLQTACSLKSGLERSGAKQAVYNNKESTLSTPSPSASQPNIIGTYTQIAYGNVTFYANQSCVFNEVPFIYSVDVSSKTVSLLAQDYWVYLFGNDTITGNYTTNAKTNTVSTVSIVADPDIPPVVFARID